METLEEGPKEGGGEDKTEEGSFYFASVDFWRSLKRVVGSWLRLYARWRSSGAGFFSFTNDEHPFFFFFFSVWLSSDKRRVWTSLDELSSSLVNRVSGFLFLDKILLISCSSNLAFFLLLQSFLTINFASLVWILLFFFPITKYTNCLEKRIDHNLTFLYLIKPSMLKRIYIYTKNCNRYNFIESRDKEDVGDRKVDSILWMNRVRGNWPISRER